MVRVGDWRAHARRFTGESVRVREEAIEALKEDPKLSEKLKKALGTPDHFLALDVISVLKLRSFFATLLAFAEKDKTGYSYHVINSLMTPSQIPEVSRVYLQRLTDPMISPASKIALIDALGRMQTRLEIPLVRTLLKDTYPEIRSATLYYVRTAVLKWKRPEYLVFLDEAITDPTYQLRMQTLHLARELPEKLRTTRVGAFRKLFAPCLEDPVAEVKALCREMNEKLPGGAT